MAWLTIVGIGADGVAGLGQRACDALAAAEVLVGGARHLAMVPPDARQQRLAWRSPLGDTLAELETLRLRRVAVLATGDPLWFGIGRLLLRRFPAAELCILPHVSAFQEACARLGWALEEVDPLTAHGRPLAGLRRHLQPGRRLLVLTADGSAPAEIARMLVDSGLGDSLIRVMEELAGPQERIVQATAAELTAARFADLNVMAIETVGSAETLALPAVPGLPDEAFEHDGQITKAEVRAVSLAALAPLDGQLLWDIGAGAGSVAIEWLRAGRRMRAVAVERDPTRAARIGRNAARLGVPELEVRHGEAPDCLPSDTPDAIFIGGGSGAPGLIDLCWGKLRPGGRLVVNAVTIAGEVAMLAFHGTHGGKLLRLALTRSEVMGGQLIWRPALPVTQLSTRKPCGAAS